MNSNTISSLPLHPPLSRFLFLSLKHTLSLHFCLFLCLFQGQFQRVLHGCILWLLQWAEICGCCEECEFSVFPFVSSSLAVKRFFQCVSLWKSDVHYILILTSYVVYEDNGDSFKLKSETDKGVQGGQSANCARQGSHAWICPYVVVLIHKHPFFLLTVPGPDLILREVGSEEYWDTHHAEGGVRNQHFVK